MDRIMDPVVKCLITGESLVRIHPSRLGIYSIKLRHGPGV